VPHERNLPRTQRHSNWRWRRCSRPGPCGPGTRACGQGEDGSALLLIPAGFIALLVLAALAFDQARLFGIRRELLDISASTASDAAAAILDRGAYYENGQLTAGSVGGQALLDEQLAVRGLTGRVSGTVRVRNEPGGPVVIVELTTTATSLFARMAPGGWARTDVHVVSSASLDTF
jgi:hypothetical protein